jgi:hypothetical protein
VKKASKLCWLTFNGLLCVISQNTELFITTAVRTSNPTIIIVSGVGLSPLGTAATTGPLYQPQMIDGGDCGEIGGMKIGRVNRINPTIRVLFITERKLHITIYE